MRLLLDLQCVQSTSALRGIGRYALCLSRALVETAGTHTVGVLLNGGDDPARLRRARTALETFLPARDIHVFEAAWPFGQGRTPERRRAAEAARLAAVRSLAPDAVLVGSVFEGDTENVCSIDGSAASPPTAALLFDLIPAADPGTYLLGPGADDYWRRFEDLRRADLLLSISDYSADQARRLLGETCPPCRTVWGGPYPSGAFPQFEHRQAAPPDVALPRQFLLAVGGDHPRKNLDGLVIAWGRVPAVTRQRAPLVIACRLNVGTVRRLRRLARRAGVTGQELLLLGEVAEDRLAQLYEQALAFVFPSTEEGLGMPPLEAMARGCPTMLARSSSLVELADDDRAFMDPYDHTAMAAVLGALLEDEELRAHLRGVADASAVRFTWERSARLAWSALEGIQGSSSRGAAARAPRLVAVDDLAAVRALPVSPAAVHVRDLSAFDASAALDLLPAQVVGEERQLGLVGTGTPGLRAALAPATALVVDQPAVARALLEAGLLWQPVVEAHELERAAVHDPVEALSSLLAEDPPRDVLARDVVLAATRPARWTLQRPWPVVLVLRADWSSDPSPADLRARLPDVAVVCGSAAAAPLAAAVDHVLVQADLASTVAARLEPAQRVGAAVHVVASWAGPLPELDRRTGWPWTPRD